MIGLKQSVLLALCGSTYTVRAQTYPPADPHATTATQNLYRHLQQIQHTAVLFGHQDDLAYGVGWAYEPGRSDVQSTTGAYMREVYKCGDSNTTSWHLNNPVTGNTAWDRTHGALLRALPWPGQRRAFSVLLPCPQRVVSGQADAPAHL